MATAGAALLLVIGLAVLGWFWRHPSTFETAGGWGVGNDRWPVGTPLFVGMTYEVDDAQGTVSIHSA